jgi:prepilin-type N-terminal cleavage/methylation domain-containing protein
MLKTFRHRGFTLLELILVMAVVSLTTLSISSFNLLTVRNTHYTTIGQEIKQAILNSQSLSRQSYLDLKSGVVFEVDQFIEFTADTYDSLDDRNQVTELYSGLTISDVDFGGSNIIYFEKHTGLPVNSGQLTLNNSDGRQILIQVDSNGITTLTNQ